MTDHVHVEVTEFVERLSVLTAVELADVAARLRHAHDTADAELSWWRATLVVGAGLRRHHRSREAGIAAHRASDAVQHAATLSELPLDRDDVVVVARAAADVARLLIADHDHDVPASTLTVVLAPWHLVVPAAA